MPKKQTVRIITNMNHRLGKTTNTSIDDTVLSNAMLYNCFYVLKYIYGNSSRQQGFNVLNKDVIYERFKAFKSCGDHGLNYVVTLDIQKCFDSIDCHKLFEMLEQLLSDYASSDFIIHKYTISQHHQVKNQRHHHNIRYVTQNNLLHFHDVSKQLNQHYRNCVLIDGVHYPSLNVSSLLRLLKQHLFHHKISYNKEVFRSTLGLPQGSVLSSLLCNIYYGCLESKAYLSDSASMPESTMVMRQVDDYLVISKDKESISKYDILYLFLFS